MKDTKAKQQSLERMNILSKWKLHLLGGGTGYSKTNVKLVIVYVEVSLKKTEGEQWGQQKERKWRIQTQGIRFLLSCCFQNFQKEKF